MYVWCDISKEYLCHYIRNPWSCNLNSCTKTVRCDAIVEEGGRPLKRWPFWRFLSRSRSKSRWGVAPLLCSRLKAPVVGSVLLQSVRTHIMEFTVLLLIATVILVVFWIFNLKARKRSRLPPGPPGIPVLGNLLQLDKKAPFKTFLKVRTR